MSDEKNRLNKSTYAPEYPLNKVMVTESGHEIHYDDTKGKERIRIAHKDGSYDEISAGGKRVSYTVGQHQQYNKSGLTVTTDENYDVKVEGHSRTSIGGGTHTEIRGESSLVVGSGVNIVCNGPANIAVSGDVYLGAAGSLNMNVAGDMNLDVAGATTMKSGGDTKINAANIRLNG